MICSFEFVLGLLLLSAIFFRLPEGKPRQVAVAACSLLFLSRLVPDGATWAVLLGFLVSGWVAAWALATRPSRAILATYLALLLAAFLVLKKYTFLVVLLPSRWTSFTVSVVGLSFMLFRQIQFVVDAAEGQVQPFPSLWTYLNYQLNAFTLLSGPIQRFGDFHAWWERPKPLLLERHDILRAYLRVMLGILEIAVVAAACEALAKAAHLDLSFPHPRSVLRVPVLFYTFPAFVYFNFSGYCDIVIGGASLLGLRLPENFNRPYLARNMIDFWTRWHISLGVWIRDYLFSPLFAALTRWRPARTGTWAMVAYFVALFLAGVWHGATVNFVIFGFLNGVGVAVAKLWENRILRRGGRKALREYLASPRVRRAATLANLHFVCFTMLFFTPDNLLDPLKELFRRR